MPQHLTIIEHTDEPDADRWYIVVLTGDNDDRYAVSRRAHRAVGSHVEEYGGPWALLTRAQADELAELVNDNDPTYRAQVLEVFRYDGDPVWKES